MLPKRAVFRVGASCLSLTAPPITTMLADMTEVLDGRVAIVTGGGHGIGKAYCECLAQNGAAVVVAEIDGDAAERTASALRNSGARALEVQTDVADETSTRAMAQR